MRNNRIGTVPRSLRPTRKLPLELLESRRMLSASNVFSEQFGVITPTVSSPGFDVSISAPEFTVAGGSVQIGVSVRPVTGSYLDPAAANVRTSAGSSVGAKLAVSDIPGSHTSIAIFNLANGNYHIDVAAEQGSTGAYVVDLFLVGDSNGDLRVNATDINALRQRFGAKVGDANFVSEMDLDADGRITSLDLAWAVGNSGDATSLRVASARTILWDGGGGDGLWNNPLNWTGDRLPTGVDSVLVDVPAPITITSPITVGQLTLRNGASLTHNTGDQHGLAAYILGDALFDALSGIEVSGRGYLFNQGPGQGGSVNSTDGQGGGGYAGEGGNNGSGYAAGGAYGSLLRPSDLGSAGGAHNPVNVRLGGGAVWLEVGGSLTVDGAVRASGYWGDNGAAFEAGAGSGGSIYIHAQTIAGNGEFAADGGYGFNQGGGGGGRIALYAHSSTFAGTAHAWGGGGSQQGGAGSIYRTITDEVYASLIFDNGGSIGNRTLLFEDLVLGANVEVRNGAILSAQSLQPLRINISGSLTVDASSSIDATGNGHAANAGPGAGGFNLFNTDGNGGGGYGGVGGAGAFGGGAGGATYGSIETPTDFGSGGGNDGSGAGAGGGVIQLNIGNQLRVDGSIVVNGQSWGGYPGSGGGGSGGSLQITAHQLTGAGVLASNGGNAYGNGRSSGGGGGRVAIYYDDSTFTGQFEAHGGTGSEAAGAGSVFLKKSNSSLASLLFDNGGFSGARTVISGDQNWIANVEVRNGAILSSLPLQALRLTVAGNLTVGSGSRIDVSGNGYGPNSGPGAGKYHLFNTDGNGGAGYGGAGAGAAFYEDAGGGSYGSALEPIEFGSGGGDDGTGAGAGGGAIRLVVDKELLVDGGIVANGQSWDGFPGSGGGGSGGSIYITANIVAGDGYLSSVGGSSYGNGRSGGGGGGRIAVYSATNAFTGVVSVFGGTGAFHGYEGTKVFQNLGSLSATPSAISPTDDGKAELVVDSIFANWEAAHKNRIATRSADESTASSRINKKVFFRLVAVQPIHTTLI